MIDPALLKNEDSLALVQKNLEKRRYSLSALDELKKVVKIRSDLIVRLEQKQNRRNIISKEIGQLQAAKSAGQAIEQLKSEVKIIGEEIKSLKEEQESLESIYQEALMALPNMLQAPVPEGDDEKANVCVRQWGEIPAFDFAVKPHFEVAEQQGLVDFERGVKLSGSRFYVYNEIISRLERKLIAFMLARHEKNGYLERTVPLLVKDDCMVGTGQFPKFKDEYYRMEADGLSLIPTGEVPLTNLYAGEILPEAALPLYLTAATACFRREAGSAGRDTRGLVRVHQFQKVELVKFVHPDTSAAELEKLTAEAASILEQLGLTYRVMLLSSGDTSFSSSMTYDLEIWMPGLNRWLEISSCSNFLDFQARRAQIRFKNAAGKNELLHTLNGSGVAAGRLIAALLEYHQNPDGSIDWPAIEQKISRQIS